MKPEYFKNGFTLIEALISLVILATFSYFAMVNFDNTFENYENLENKIEANEIVNRLKIILAHQQSCLASVENSPSIKNLNLITSPNAIKNKELRIFTHENSAAPPVLDLENNMMKNNLRVTQLKFKDEEPIRTEDFLLTKLMVEFKSKNTSNKTTYRREINLNLQLDQNTGKIKNCSSGVGLVKPICVGYKFKKGSANPVDIKPYDTFSQSQQSTAISVRPPGIAGSNAFIPNLAEKWGFSCNSPWVLVNCSLSTIATNLADTDLISTAAFCYSEDDEYMKLTTLYGTCCRTF